MTAANGGITRANFVGGGMGRRGFLKMLAGAGAGIAGLKSGLVNILGKGAGKEVAKEVVQTINRLHLLHISLSLQKKLK